MNYGWAGELNLKYTLTALFERPLGEGYPLEDAQRKIKDTMLLKSIQAVSRTPMVDLLNKLNENFCNKILNRRNIVDYILDNDKEQDIIKWIKTR